MNKSVKPILEQLVSFDTTSYKSNLELIDYVKEILLDYGLKSEIYFDQSGNKANLYTVLPGKEKGGVMLSGHTDVVPVNGQAWTVSPFQLTEKHERYYGRGTADMKGFIACVLASLPDFLSSELRIPLHLAFSYDEEVGCKGVGSLINDLKFNDNKPNFCIVGEPTQMQPIYGHKGKVAKRCQVHGHACHSAYAPNGVNAIEYATRLIHKIITISESLQDKQDERFDPSFCTMQVGTIHGGNALNIVPQLCEFDFEIRHLPDVSVDNVLSAIEDYAYQVLLPKMQAISSDARIEFKELSKYPGLLTDINLEFAEKLLQWSDYDFFSTVAFGTEGGLFQEVNITTLVCGPGSMDQGHKADEFITVEQLDKCNVMLKKLNQWMI